MYDLFASIGTYCLILFDFTVSYLWKMSFFHGFLILAVPLTCILSLYSSFRDFYLSMSISELKSLCQLGRFSAIFLKVVTFLISWFLPVNPATHIKRKKYIHQS